MCGDFCAVKRVNDLFIADQKERVLFKTINRPIR